MSANVFIQKSQLGGGSPMIRGFATNRLLIVVDGVRMNTAIFRSGNLQNVISLDANSLDHTEVIFGPGSVIYGSDAIAGVMNFYTFSPRLSMGDNVIFNASAMTRYSSADQEKTGHLHFNIGTNKWGFLTSVTYSDFDNLVMGSNGPDDFLRPTYQDRINGHDTVLVNPDPKEQIESGYNQLNLNFGLFEIRQAASSEGRNTTICRMVLRTTGLDDECVNGNELFFEFYL
ncbi:MAG: TonB-dependent receptor plug domain-containing protein [Ignavibacteriaceae bacterium]